MPRRTTCGTLRRPPNAVLILSINSLSPTFITWLRSKKRDAWLFSLPLRVESQPHKVIAYFRISGLLIGGHDCTRRDSERLVPVPRYRERVSTACTGLVLKSGLTNTFAKTSMGIV